MQNLKKNRRGQGLVEYIVLVCLIAVGVIGAVRLVSGALQLKFTTTAGTITGL